MPESASQRFLRDPDQAERRRELTAFIGPNAQSYLSVYDSMVEEANRAPGTRPKFVLFQSGFSVASFLFGPAWFFYRKLWVWGSALAVVYIALGFTPFANRVGIPLGMAVALSAKRFYLLHATSSISKLAGRTDASLTAVGGISTTAGWICGVVFAILLAFIINDAAQQFGTT